MRSSNDEADIHFRLMLTSVAGVNRIANENKQKIGYM